MTVLAGCDGVRVAMANSAQHRAGPVAFVLSGGGSISAVQVGMIHVLFERGIAPELIVAASAGAFNGGFIASRPPVALAPAVMFVALVGHPFIARLPDAAGVANAVEQSVTWWGVVHLLTAVGVGLTALAFLAIRARLRDAGEDRFSVWALPFVIAGSALYGLLPALEFAPMSAALTGGDAAALLVLALSRMLPLGVAQFYVQAIAGPCRAVAAGLPPVAGTPAPSGQDRSVCGQCLKSPGRPRQGGAQVPTGPKQSAPKGSISPGQ